MRMNLAYFIKHYHRNPYIFVENDVQVVSTAKVRLTGMAASNALGEKLPMFVIGKYAKPRCFKHVRNLPCRYRSQKKSWMDGKLFEEWLRELDRKFVMEGRKIVMVVDNCPAHPDVSGLKCINLQFLPLNTTSCTQPMDQGVIRYDLFSIIRNRQMKIQLALSNSNLYYSNTVTGKRVNLGDGQGLQIPCTILFKGEEKYIEILKKQLNSNPH